MSEINARQVSRVRNKFDFELEKAYEKRCASTIHVVNSLRGYLRLTWDVDTNNLKILYKSVVIPTLLYGWSVWAGTLRLKWYKKNLRSTQRHMTCCIARSLRSVSALLFWSLHTICPLITSSFNRPVRDIFNSTVSRLRYLLERLFRII